MIGSNTKYVRMMKPTKTNPELDRIDEEKRRLSERELFLRQYVDVPWDEGSPTIEHFLDLQEYLRGGKIPQHWQNSWKRKREADIYYIIKDLSIPKKLTEARYFFRDMFSECDMKGAYIYAAMTYLIKTELSERGDTNRKILKDGPFIWLTSLSRQNESKRIRHLRNMEDILEEEFSSFFDRAGQTGPWLCRYSMNIMDVEPDNDFNDLDQSLVGGAADELYITYAKESLPRAPAIYFLIGGGDVLPFNPRHKAEPEIICRLKDSDGNLKPFHPARDAKLECGFVKYFFEEQEISLNASIRIKDDKKGHAHIYRARRPDYRSPEGLRLLAPVRRDSVVPKGAYR